MAPKLAKTIRYLENLISFNTVSEKSNLNIINYLKDVFEEYPAISFFEVKNQTENKANIFATLPASSGEKNGGIVLSGHLDVVPVSGQNWSSDPFKLRQNDGKLFGRGTCDMKGFIACCLAVLPDFVSATRQKPIHFSFTYDEEVGCIGARVLIEHLNQNGITPDIAIIGEPTSMQVIEGHKSCSKYITKFRGLPGHSSMPDSGVNAIEYAVRYVNKLLNIKEELKARMPNKSPYNPPYSTLQIGRIKGGVAFNVIAEHCQVEWDTRVIEKIDNDYIHKNIDDFAKNILLPAMQQVFADSTIAKETISNVEGLRIVESSVAKDLVQQLTNTYNAGVVSFGTEAGLFQNLGSSSIICGPGSIEQAHKANEFISLEQLDFCLDFLHRLLKKNS